MSENIEKENDGFEGFTAFCTLGFVILMIFAFLGFADTCISWMRAYTPEQFSDAAMACERVNMNTEWRTNQFGNYNVRCINK